MNTKIEKASKSAMEEIRAMPVEQLVAEIQKNKDSQLAVVIRQIMSFTENYLDLNKSKIYHK